MVAPYWAPDTRIKVCAYDAQANAMGTDGQPCDVYNPNLACGCGPNLRQCSPGPNTAADRAMREALTEEPARLFSPTPATVGLPRFGADSRASRFPGRVPPPSPPLVQPSPCFHRRPTRGSRTART